MAGARGTMFDVGFVEELRRRFKDLPEPKQDEISKMQLVRALAGDIEGLQKLGHSTKTIAETFCAAGVPLTNATLKTYLSKLRPSPRKPRRRRWRDTPVDAASTGDAEHRAPGVQAGINCNADAAAAPPTLAAPTEETARGAPVTSSKAIPTAREETQGNRKEEVQGVSQRDGVGSSREASSTREAIDRKRATFVAREDSRDI